MLLTQKRVGVDTRAQFCLSSKQTLFHCALLQQSSGRLEANSRIATVSIRYGHARPSLFLETRRLPRELESGFLPTSYYYCFVGTRCCKTKTFHPVSSILQGTSRRIPTIQVDACMILQQYPQDLDHNFPRKSGCCFLGSPVVWRLISVFITERRPSPF